MRYVHTNLIAKDSEKLIKFYIDVFGCRHIGQTRDLKGDWLDRMTGIPNSHIKGEHLALPGYGDMLPTIEIFTYDQVLDNQEKSVNSCGFAHLAFEVDDVSETLSQVLLHGGEMVGELVNAEYEDGRKATFVYVRDPEGNILELQSWK